MQAPLRDQEAPQYGTKYACSSCQITYMVPRGTHASCPLCDSLDRESELQAALLQARNQLELLTNQTERLKGQMDIVTAMRDALEVIGEDDLTFLKSVFYRWRDDKSVALKVTHTGTAIRKHPRSRSRTKANGFIAMPRGGEPEAHLCTSVGGLAIAEYFDEAQHMTGSIEAMALLIRALGKRLTGAIS